MQDKYNINNIHDILAEKDFIVFAGAGTCTKTGIPEWRELLKILYDQRPVDGIDIKKINARNFPEIAQMLFKEYQTRGEIKLYYDLMEKTLTPKDEPYQTIQLSTAYISNHVVTTNFDNTFEEAYREYKTREGIEDTVKTQVPKNITVKFMENNYGITCLHGLIQQREIIFTTSEYEKYYSDESPRSLQVYYNRMYKERCIVFTGFSFFDEYVINALKKAFNNMEREEMIEGGGKIKTANIETKHYAFLKREKSGDKERQLQENKLIDDLISIRIQPIIYEEHCEAVKCFQRIERSKRGKREYGKEDSEHATIL